MENRFSSESQPTRAGAVLPGHCPAVAPPESTLPVRLPSYHSHPAIPSAALLAAALYAASLEAIVAADAAPPANDVQSLTGSTVHIQLSGGKILRDAKVERFRPGKVAGTVGSVTVLDPATGQPATFGAAAIQQLKKTDGTCHLVFDSELNCLAPRDPGARAAVARAAAAQSEAAAARQVAREEAQRRQEDRDRERVERVRRETEEVERQRAEREAKRIEFFKKTSVWLWPEPTADEQQAAMAEHREFLQKVANTFPTLPLRLYETEYFLFFSDMPPGQVALYTPYLDTMYRELCKAFGIAPGTNIWRGKAVVVAFLTEAAYLSFEKAFYDINALGTHGMAHQRGDGNVVIGCFRGDDRAGFGRMLVHETAHGFMHRYKSSQIIPCWLNEGAADWISAIVVTSDDEVQRRQRAALAVIRQTRSLGGNFFTADHIDDWQYGVASGMTTFLLRLGGDRYRNLIDGIKTGKPWQQALQDAYGLTPEQLTAQWGLSVGVPGLRP